MALNKNDEIKKLHSFGDKLSDKVTAIAGSVPFLLVNTIWFIVWIMINSGQFGDSEIFDKFPFGLLTTAVSLEAIILSVFVLITQNRQSKLERLRSELDYRTDLQAEADVKTILAILERLSKHQNLDVSDLLEKLEHERTKVLAQHPLSK